VDLVLLALASVLAGFVDAIVGGGGLVMVPALFAAFPAVRPATLFGINKSASVWGTGMAALHYQRRVDIRWAALAPAAVAGFCGALGGAWAVTVIAPDALRKLLPAVLGAVLLYTLAKKELGQRHAPALSGVAEGAAAAALGLAVGFYDGFFGPGTGSFLIFLFVRVLGYDFLHASACGKLVNTATNIAALAFFAAKGQVWWQYGLALAAANVTGSVLGTRVALRQGAGFVRIVFIVVVTALLLKTGYDAFLRSA
jgi:uncharacterized protein